jgi:CO/xanthine dehydrogenase FAD-binding subunit
MDLNTAQAVVSVGSEPAGLRWPSGDRWQPGDAWLAGGSWLFSEPQPQLRRLIDLSSAGWPAISVTLGGLELAATCTLAQLFALAPASDDVRAQPEAQRLPAAWQAARLIAPCCRALRGSFKVWNVATVGGNLCLALPAGPMISLTAALDGVCTIWSAGGDVRHMSVLDFVLDAGHNALAAGELLRSIALPVAALRCRPALRQMSLHERGRSAALLIGLLHPDDGTFALTVSAATRRPIRLVFAALPGAVELADAIGGTVAADAYVDDLHGTPAWRAHLTRMYAEEIRLELATS